MYKYLNKVKNFLFAKIIKNWELEMKNRDFFVNSITFLCEREIFLCFIPCSSSKKCYLCVRIRKM